MLQTPVLFTGTMRSNLSPFGEHTDAQCWTALRRAHLAQMVESSPAGLDMMLSEGGAPFIRRAEAAGGPRTGPAPPLKGAGGLPSCVANLSADGPRATHT